MTARPLQVDRVIDHGTVVQLIGRYADDGELAIVHLDHRPFQDFWSGWSAAGKPQPVRFDADEGTLAFD